MEITGIYNSVGILFDILAASVTEIDAPFHGQLIVSFPDMIFFHISRFIVEFRNDVPLLGTIRTSMKNTRVNKKLFGM